MFQQDMSVLLSELKQRDALDPEDQDIATQLCRVLKEHPDVPEARVLSEIGILFVEGFETTGEVLGVLGPHLGSCSCLHGGAVLLVTGCQRMQFVVLTAHFNNLILR
jgi:hypothetical protein